MAPDGRGKWRADARTRLIFENLFHFSLNLELHNFDNLDNNNLHCSTDSAANATVSALSSAQIPPIHYLRL